jgi:hypothetical protein
MTYPENRTPETGTAQPVWPPQQMPAPRKKSHLPLIIAAAAVLVVVIVAAVIATLAISGGAQKTAAPKPAAAAGSIPIEGCGNFCDEPTPDATTTGPAVSASDIALTPQVTSKECFGSAGCIVGVKVKLAYDGPALDPDGTWMVTYEIKGGDDGPIIGSFNMMGDRTYEVNEETVPTPRKSTKVTIKVTGVEKVGV